MHKPIALPDAIHKAENHTTPAYSESIIFFFKVCRRGRKEKKKGREEEWKGREGRVTQETSGSRNVEGRGDERNREEEEEMEDKKRKGN